MSETYCTWFKCRGLIVLGSNADDLFYMVQMPETYCTWFKWQRLIVLGSNVGYLLYLAQISDTYCTWLKCRRYWAWLKCPISIVLVPNISLYRPVFLKNILLMDHFYALLFSMSPITIRLKKKLISFFFLLK